MIGASLLLVALTLDGGLSRPEAALLFGLLLAYTAFLVVQSRRAQGQPVDEDFRRELGGDGRRAWDDRAAVQVGLVVAGLVLLVMGSNWLVDASIAFARALGVSELIIGLTIVAAGTSTPEVAASLMALRKGERDMAVGNVIGSNVFNILGVLGLAGLVAPSALTMPESLVRFDLPAMVAVAIACLPVFFSGRRIGRWEGFMFLGYYVAYVAYLILDARGHGALTTYSTVMTWVVIPLTVVTIAVVAWRGARDAPHVR